MTTSNNNNSAAHTSHEKNNCLKDAAKDMRLKNTFTVEDWCHANDTRYTVESCKHDVTFDDGHEETRKTTYTTPDLFVKIDGNRRTILDAFDLMLKMFDDATVGQDGKAAVIGLGMLQMNTNAKNSARRSLQVRVSKKAVREAMQEFIGKLINSIGTAAAEGDMEKVQGFTQELKTAQAELSAL